MKNDFFKSIGVGMSLCLGCFLVFLSMSAIDHWVLDNVDNIILQVFIICVWMGILSGLALYIMKKFLD
jgi:hypothetical protein